MPNQNQNTTQGNHAHSPANNAPLEHAPQNLHPQRTTPATTKPTYTPDHWEKLHGKISKGGVFYKPNFVVLRNGEFIEVEGGGVSAYNYVTAFHIMLHLQAVNPHDNFTVEPCSWQPMTDYNVILDSEVKH